METVQIIGILLVFIVFVGLMMTRKLTTLLALPMMAILLAAIAGIPLCPITRIPSPSPRVCSQAGP